VVAPHSISVQALEPGAIERLIDLLVQDGRTVIAPTLHDGAISLGEITSASELLVGWTADMAPGRYELRNEHDGRLFGAPVGPVSTKRWRRSPEATVWSGQKDASGFHELPQERPNTKLAFVGLKGCDVAARILYDRAIGGSPADHFIVGVECTTPGPTCFCVSMGTGPGISEGADLVITEIVEPSHLLLTRAYTRRGADVLARLGGREPTAEEEDAAWSQVAAAARSMTEGIDPDAAAAALRIPSSEGWEDVAARCLACGNCTLVCPTCFCTRIIDRTTPDGSEASRVRLWDSCFTLDFSEVHGGPVRSSITSRYRQWISHKLSWWWDQFGSSGCVGCGRCIVWCPVGIDIRVEAAAAIERMSSHV
jgi:ferredoxin